jgi:hypothetical protein
MAHLFFENAIFTQFYGLNFFLLLFSLRKIYILCNFSTSPKQNITA